MKTPLPLSPVHDLLPATPARFSAADADPLSIADLSTLARTGVKGPGAAAWLAALGLPLPSEANSWLALDDGGLVARLGNSEYLIEGKPELVEPLLLAFRGPGVYPVLRQDASFALRGSRLDQLLLQVCNVDFRSLQTAPHQVVLTSMAGVGVTVLRMGGSAQPVYRLWCDGTYGLYLWETLVGIAEELGGAHIVLDILP